MPPLRQADVLPLINKARPAGQDRFRLINGEYQELISSTRKKLLLECHPDRHQDDPAALERAQLLNAAYDRMKTIRFQPSRPAPVFQPTAFHNGWSTGSTTSAFGGWSAGGSSFTFRSWG